jgi:hypothetical protein
MIIMAGEGYLQLKVVSEPRWGLGIPHTRKMLTFLMAREGKDMRGKSSLAGIVPF